MKNQIAKREQNYVLFSTLMLAGWFSKMYEQQAQAMPVEAVKCLPRNEAETKELLNVNFSDYDGYEKSSDVVIEEYLWGVRVGVSQYLDIFNCSLDAVLSVARTEHMAEIYSPAKVVYYLDGTRKVVPHQVSAYNTDSKFSCYSLINMLQARDLFPQYCEVFDKLPENTKFLCPDDASKLRICSQEKGEIGFSFSAVDVKMPLGFYLGNLRASFQHIAREIRVGHGRNFCNTDKVYDLDYQYGKMRFLCGANFPYAIAQNLVSDEYAQKLRQDYVRMGSKQNSFIILIDGTYCSDELVINKQSGGETTMTICVSPSVYKSWGREFTQEELEIIMRPRKFEFTEDVEKYEKLNFTNNQIQMFREKHSSKTLLTPGSLKQFIETELEKNEQEIQKALKEIVKPMFKPRPMVDLSGPSRSSIYTEW